MLGHGDSLDDLVLDVPQCLSFLNHLNSPISQYFHLLWWQCYEKFKYDHIIAREFPGFVRSWRWSGWSDPEYPTVSALSWIFQIILLL